jgi:hypothetical protein
MNTNEIHRVKTIKNVNRIDFFDRLWVFYTNYHQLSDELITLNIPNITQIIKSIALSAKGIISGKETHTKVEVGTLK